MNWEQREGPDSNPSFTSPFSELKSLGCHQDLSAPASWSGCPVLFGSHYTRHCLCSTCPDRQVSTVSEHLSKHWHSLSPHTLQKKKRKIPDLQVVKPSGSVCHCVLQCLEERALCVWLCQGKATCL